MTSTIATHPRAVILALIAVGLMLGLITGSTLLSPKSASADGHVTGLENIVAGDVVVDHELGKRTSSETVRIWGSGFAPGQEVILLVNDGPGTPSDITGFTSNRSDNGTLVANERGAWTTLWTLGRFTRQRSGIGPGDGDVERVRTLAAVDPSTFDVVASTPLAFCRVTDRANQRVEVAAPLAAAQAELDAATARQETAAAAQEQLTASVAENEVTIAAYEAMLPRKQAMLAEKQAMLPRKQAMLAERQAVLPEKQAMLAEKQAVVDRPLPTRPPAMSDVSWELVLSFFVERAAARALEVEALSAEVAALGAEVEALGAEVEALGAEIEALSAEVPMLSTQISTLTAQNEAAVARIAGLAAELDGLPARIALLTGTIETITPGVEAALEEIVAAAHCPS